MILGILPADLAQVQVSVRPSQQTTSRASSTFMPPQTHSQRPWGGRSVNRIPLTCMHCQVLLFRAYKLGAMPGVVQGVLGVCLGCAWGDKRCDEGVCRGWLGICRGCAGGVRDCAAVPGGVQRVSRGCRGWAGGCAGGGQNMGTNRGPAAV